jgi:uncharacterized protein YqeY
MSLFEQLQQASLAARKERNQSTLDTFQMLLSQIKNEKINLMKKEELTDEEVVKVLKKFIKQLKDALADFEKAGRQELVENAKREIELVSHYLPAQMSELEVEAMVVEAIAETGATSEKDFPRVMGIVVKKVAGRADGSLVQSMVKKKLPSH